MDRNRSINFNKLLTHLPDAVAIIYGSPQYQKLYGNVRFYQTDQGVLVVADVEGLPGGNSCTSPIFALHIHEGSSCTGKADDPFADVRMHYNPYNCPHPYHAGDLPPLFGADGRAFSAFLTNRFSVSDVVGKTVIIHGSPDDFTTQPSGNAGQKIACGEIFLTRRRSR